jgi:hypothetical protein
MRRQVSRSERLKTWIDVKVTKRKGNDCYAYFHQNRYSLQEEMDETTGVYIRMMRSSNYVVKRGVGVDGWRGGMD